MGNARRDDIQCTYFDVKQSCSVDGCENRPAMRKTGKCAPHSVTPYDQTRENDWVDCYEGCVKHDLVARRRYLNLERSKQHKINVVHVPKEPTPAPRIDRLFNLHKHDREKRQAMLNKLLKEALLTRGITHIQMATHLGVSDETLRNRLVAPSKRSGQVFSFMEVCDIVEYIRDWDKKQKEAQ